MSGRAPCCGDRRQPFSQVARVSTGEHLEPHEQELVRTLEAGDEIYVTGRFKGTHQNDLTTPLGTIVAAGNTLDLLFVDYFRVDNGKIVECEVVRDRLGMITQLGRPSEPR